MGVRSFPWTSRLAALALCGAALTGCVVGPNYKGPPAVAPEATTAPRFLRAEASTPAAPPPARWWTALGDPELDRLEADALRSSPDLASVAARLRQARAELGTAKANRLPNTGASAVYLRSKGATNLFTGGAVAASAPGGQTTDETAAAAEDTTIAFYDVGFDASWEIDLFGGHARAVEGARAAAQGAQDSLEDAEVSLAAEVASSYLQLRLVQNRLALTGRAADVQARLVTLVRERQQGGTASDLDVVRLEGELETSRAAETPLRAQLTAGLDRLAVLTGRPPGALDDELAAPAAIPAPPASVPVGDPASLIRRRPDVRRAERRIEEETALIGQRTADFFPKVTLFGDIGFGSADVTRLLSGSSFTYLAAPYLQWTPFDFGRIRAKVRQAGAMRDQAEADYRQAVLAALQDAETSLSRYGREREELAGLLRVEGSADRAERLTQVQVQGGAATSLDVLEAERRSLQAETDVIQARAELTQDYASLQKSLGLGWSAPASPPDR